MKKSIFKAIGFVIIFCGIIFSITNIFRLKNGTGVISLSEFYDQKDNQVDVIFLGSSHSFVNTNIPYLWDTYGMAGFCLGGPEQAPWESYYYLQEALKTQKPSAVVFETYTVLRDGDYNKNEARIIENTTGLKFSVNKLKSICVNAPKEMRADLLLELSLFHGRYSELSEQDFSKETWNTQDYYKGSNPRYGVKELAQPAGTDMNAFESLGNKQEEYLRKIIELCKQNGIQIILTMAPAPEVVKKSGRINRISQVSAEYGVPFIDFNSDEMLSKVNFNYHTDFFDKGHLNAEGTIKYSNYLGKFLTQSYHIPIRKEQTEWNSWEEASSRYHQTYNNDQISKAENEDTLYRDLQQGSYTIFILNKDFSAENMSEAQRELFHKLRVSPDSMEKASGIVVEENQTLYHSSYAKSPYYTDNNGTDILLEQNSLYINEERIVQENSLTMVVFDKKQQRIADTIYWKNEKMHHQ